MSKLHFHRKDIETIAEVLKQFPNTDSFELEISSESGIGTTAKMIIPVYLNGHHGDFYLEIWGSEDW